MEIFLPGQLVNYPSSSDDPIITMYCSSVTRYIIWSQLSAYIGLNIRVSNALHCHIMWPNNRVINLLAEDPSIKSRRMVDVSGLNVYKTHSLRNKHISMTTLTDWFMIVFISNLLKFHQKSTAVINKIKASLALLHYQFTSSFESGLTLFRW